MARRRTSRRHLLQIHDYAGHAFTYELARTLADQGAGEGFEVDYAWCAATNTPNGRNHDTTHLRTFGLGQGWTFEKYRTLGRAASELRLGLAAGRLILRRRPTGVVATNMPVLSALVMWSAAAVVGARRVLWFQDAQAGLAAAVRGPRHPVTRVARVLERQALRRADRVIAVSDQLLTIAREHGVADARSEVLENWAPVEALPVRPRDNAWARTEGLVDETVFLYAGTLAMKHRPERLVELAERFEDDGHGVMVVISTGDGADELRRVGGHLSRLRVYDYLPHEQLADALGAADVLVVLLEDGAGAVSVPSKTLAYLCAGRPVLASIPLDNLVARLLDERAAAGLVVAPTDAAGFHVAAEKLQHDGTLRAWLGGNGRRYAEAHFGAEHVAREFRRAARLEHLGQRRVTLVQTAIGGYRRAFVADLRARLGDRLTLAYGDHHIERSLRTGIDEAPGDVRFTSRFLAGRRLVWQPGARRALAGADVWVLELNPRLVSTWLALVEARLRGRRTVVWGHLLGRRIGETGPRLGRRLQTRLAHAVLAYTEHEAAGFRRAFPGQQVYVAPNAIDRAADLQPATAGQRTDVVSIGRLTADKHPLELVDGFVHAQRTGRLPAASRLVMVGDGPLRDELIAHLATLGADADHVVVQPGSYDADRLDAVYRTAFTAACGGYVGLNVVQSLSRGVPFVHPEHAAHSPEVVLAEPGVNAFAFAELCAVAIADALAAAWRATAEGAIDPAAIQRRALASASVEAMVDGFVVAVDRV